MKNNTVAPSGGYTLIKSLLLSYLITAAALLLLAFLLFRFQLGEDKVTLGITIIYIASCLAGGFFAGKKMGNRKFLWGILLGICYGALLLGITLLVEHQLDSDTQRVLTTLFLCLGGGMLGGMLS